MNLESLSLSLSLPSCRKGREDTSNTSKRVEDHEAGPVGGAGQWQVHQAAEAAGECCISGNDIRILRYCNDIAYDSVPDILFFGLRYSDIAILHPILAHFLRYRRTYRVARFSALQRPPVVYEYRTRYRSFFADIVGKTTISKIWQGFRLYSVLPSYTNIVVFSTIS